MPGECLIQERILLKHEGSCITLPMWPSGTQQEDPFRVTHGALPPRAEISFPDTSLAIPQLASGSSLLLLQQSSPPGCSLPFFHLAFPASPLPCSSLPFSMVTRALRADLAPTLVPSQTRGQPWPCYQNIFKNPTLQNTSGVNSNSH